MNSYDVTECQPHTAATALLGMRPSGHLGGSPPIKTFRSNLAGKMGPTPLQLDVVGSDVHQPESRFRILQQTHWWELIPFEARACWTTAPEKCGHCNNPEMKIMRSLKKDWPFGWFWLKRIVMSINIELIRTPLMSPHTSKRFAEVALSCFGLKKRIPQNPRKSPHVLIEMTCFRDYPHTQVTRKPSKFIQATGPLAENISGSSRGSSLFGWWYLLCPAFKTMISFSDSMKVNMLLFWMCTCLITCFISTEFPQCIFSASSTTNQLDCCHWRSGFPFVSDGCAACQLSENRVSCYQFPH